MQGVGQNQSPQGRSKGQEVKTQMELGDEEGLEPGQKQEAKQGLSGVT